MKTKGQTLIEVLVGLATAVVILSAITLATLTSLDNIEFSKNQNQATQYANQGMELIRNMRDTQYSLFSQLSNHYCMAKSCRSLTSAPGMCGSSLTQVACGQNVDTFVREVFFEKQSTTCQGVNTKVTVSVSWFDTKCQSSTSPFCHQVVIVSCFGSTTP